MKAPLVSVPCSAVIIPTLSRRLLSGSTLLLTLVISAYGDPWLEGVDVSSYNGNVDWNQVAGSGRVFAFARVSDGLGVDSNFDSNYAGIQTAGMIRGAYQFFEPGQDPVAQADLLLAEIGPLMSGDLAPVLDVEVTGGKSPAALAGEIQTWVTTVEQATGEAPMIYTGKNFWNSDVVSANFSADPLWYAAWGISLPTPTSLPLGWHDWQFWQYSISGSVAGIGFATDLDRFNGSISDLGALAHVTSDSVPDATSTLVQTIISLAVLIALRRRTGRAQVT